MKKIYALTLITLMFTVHFLAAQKNNPEKLSLDSGSIESQFDYVTKKSGNYQEYEVIKKEWIARLKNNVLDSLNTAKTLNNQLNNQINSQQGKINQLNTNVNDLNEQLTSVDAEKSSISFFGMRIQKSSYNIIMWGVISFLSLVLFLFIYKFQRSNVITREAKMRLSELEDEFEAHRRNALERQQKLSRQLQDERIKQRNLVEK
ncbi:tRNA (guanine-N1)-methyltransferase [Leptobacterium sp. I13]|uniref:tRNA (guanine-N1)-methyltransferase n=1 Tax=Leptobacterium meishanense TaxID=3128904 RepID=UPI0030EE9070